MEKIFNECEIHRIYKKGEVILKLSTQNDLFGFGFFTPEKIHMNTARAVQDTQCSFLGTDELKKLMTLSFMTWSETTAG